jgi:nitroreductase
MDIEKIIRERRSIRNYTNKKIPKETLKELIELANWAPSPSHAENREFVIITDEKTKKKMDEATGNQHYGGSALIVVLSKKDWMEKNRFKELCINEWKIGDEKTIDKYFDQWAEMWRIQDAAIATENLLLAAWNKGIGSCWMGVFDEEKIKKILGISDTHSVTAVISLGYFDKSHKSTRKSADELIHWERW